MEWAISTAPDAARDSQVRDRLIEYNCEASEAVRERFRPSNLKSRPVAAYALGRTGELLGGSVGYTEDLWHWLTVDLMWIDTSQRKTGLGRALLSEVERQARARGCRWAKLNTWDFQAPGFYVSCGYEVYAEEPDYPPGHTNYLLRKTL